MRSKARRFTAIIATAMLVPLGLMVSGCTEETTSQAKSSEPRHIDIIENPVPESGSRGLTQIQCIDRDSNPTIGSVKQSEPNRTDANGETNVDLERYLISPERFARFESVMRNEGPTIVQGLIDGTFGNMVRVDMFGEPLHENYVGWAGATTRGSHLTSTTNVSIWAWWSGNGYIDPTKIHALGIIDKYNTDVKTLIDGPEALNNYWSAEYTENGVTTSGSSILSYVTCLGWGVDPNPEDSFVPPASLEELRELDDKVIDQFKANVASWDKATAG